MDSNTGTSGDKDEMISELGLDGSNDTQDAALEGRTAPRKPNIKHISMPG
jgi:hypothetical protein